MITFLYVGVVLLSGSPPTWLAGTDWLTRPIHDRVEQVEAPKHTAVPIVRFEESAELAEPTDDDETKHRLLPFNARLDVAALESQTGLYESSADRVLTRFRLRAFPSRGSPSA